MPDDVNYRPYCALILPMKSSFALGRCGSLTGILDLIASGIDR